ncbi:MAG: hypothetical protein LWX83_02700 [Anaerolineae bacterium]|nr:hypothetical protein [Anaerolineae bacterium]
MKYKLLLVSLLVFSLLLSACGGQNQEQALAVAVALTQTAAGPAATATPIPTATQEATGTINGTVNVMAPPTPHMTVYAVDPATKKWASVETQPSDGAASFSLTVPVGSYQVFAFSDGGGGVAYYIDASQLALVSVSAGATVNNIGVHTPSQNECGSMLDIPASPDGKFQAKPGPAAGCQPGSEQSASADSTTPTRVQFSAGSSSWYTNGDVLPGSSIGYVLYANKGQTMSVTLATTPASSGTFYIRTADGIIIQPKAYSSWTFVLPASQDYVVGVDNPTQQTIQYSLTISIPPNNASASSSTTSPTAVPTVVPVSGPVNQTIRFDAGPMSVQLTGAVVSGQRDRYNLSLSKGEMLDVIITSLEANAVFSIIGPDGNALPGTEEGKDTNNWAVPAPSDGSYSIVVGSTRGNATYTLDVKVD